MFVYIIGAYLASCIASCDAIDKVVRCCKGLPLVKNAFSAGRNKDTFAIFFLFLNYVVTRINASVTQLISAAKSAPTDGIGARSCALLTVLIKKHAQITWGVWQGLNGAIVGNALVNYSCSCTICLLVLKMEIILTTEAPSSVI